MSSFPFSNQYLTLGDAFYVKTDPSPVRSPALIKYNKDVAQSLDLPEMNEAELAAIFSGNEVPTGAEPLAMAYSGHQFGNFTQLGDGRAILLGEVASTAGNVFDIQLKGSGRTAYSRGGDGRAALGPVLREYLVSEAMEKLGVPTTRALAAVTTGEEVTRDQLLPGGIITRVSKSFVRVGTFQHYLARDDIDSTRTLADFVIERLYPETKESDNVYTALLKAVIDNQAVLIARWMQFGFIHGVMNTDNMSISGETIDYGPCAFMDFYKHDKVYSSIDRHGRYAYNNQPNIGMWNLTRFAETLLPLLADNTESAIEIAQEALKTFVETYQRAWLDGMRSKLGLYEVSDNNAHEDKGLIEDLLNTMDANSADFTLTFYYLSQLSANDTENDNDVRSLFDDPSQFDAWVIKWRDRLNAESLDDEERNSKMQAVNPLYIPRNHRIEAAIRAAEDHGDFSVFHELHEVLQNPYQEQAGKELYRLPPEPDEVVFKTFCGT